jgi:cyclohexyl-isocyanide hydratase
MIERRTLLASLGAMAMFGGTKARAQERSQSAREAHEAAMKADGPVRDIAMVMYPGFFAQDMVGPHMVLAMLPRTRVHLIARTADTIYATPGKLPIVPTGTFADCPRDLDLLLVPGGAFSTIEALKSEETVAFVRDRGSRAKWVTSVCTGSLILGAAGLLQGYKATSHWLTHDLVARFGATPTRGRVVVDRNRATGGGVTAGLDFGLKVASILDGDHMAQAVQLAAEYDPEPPFHAGSPERAPQDVKAMVDEMYAPFVKAVTATVDKLARELKT